LFPNQPRRLAVTDTVRYLLDEVRIPRSRYKGELAMALAGLPSVSA
jgi:hypothetical protein